MYLIMEMSVQLLKAGGEISRVEDTLRRMGEAYGASRMNVFAITSSIVVTAEYPDGDTITESRRIWGSSTTDFGKIEDINSLSRRCCREKLTLAELEKEIEAIKKEQYPIALTTLGSVLAAFSFALFFGGTLLDALVSILGALMIVGLGQLFSKTLPNRFASQILTSLLVGLFVGFLGRATKVLHVDKVLIGDIMLLIPGMALTNAVRDILLGDTIAGVLRLTEAILWAIGLALGFMLSMVIVGGLVL